MLTFLCIAFARTLGGPLAGVNSNDPNQTFTYLKMLIALLQWGIGYSNYFVTLFKPRYDTHIHHIDFFISMMCS